MLHRDRDKAHLWDMLEHAKLAMQATQGISEHEYLHDRLRQLALERALEIVGEAARRLSEDFRLAHPSIPWRKIIGHRNIIAHEYDEILQELLWTTATEQLPDLVAALELLLPHAGGDTE